MIPLFQQGAFTAGPNDTPETIAQKRAYIASMMPRFGSAKYVGEGLGQLATGVVIGRQNKKLNQAEGAGRKSADDLFSRLFGTANSARSADVQGPMSVLGVQQGSGSSGGSVAPMSPNDALAADAMAALGKGAGMDRLTGVDPRIDEVVRLAAQSLGLNIGVSEGLRDLETQKKYFAEGKSQTMDSKHLHGNAVDYYIIGPDGKPNWDFEAYRPLAEEAKRIAAEKGYAGFGWGGDWKTLKDGVHFQFDGHDHSNDPTVPAMPGGTAPAASAVPAGNYGGPQGGGVPLAELQLALQNPWLSGEQKALIAGMIEQQTQAADPMRQIEYEKAQLELEALKNPTAKPGFTTLTDAEVQQLGLPPGVYQRGPDGRIDTIEKTQGTAEDGRYQPVGGQIWDMRPDGGGPPQLVGGGSEEVIYGPDGQPIVTRGPAGSSKPFTESQSKDVVFSTRAKGALEAFDPIADALIDRGDSAAGWLPWGLGGAAQSETYQVAETAGNEFLQAILRKDTGAAITEDEQALYGKTYLPRPGDSPARLQYKKEARQRAVAALEAGMSPAQIIAQERALDKGEAPAKETPAAPSGNMDFSKMGIAEVGQVDIGSLTPEQMDALEKRMTELGL